MRAEQVEKRPDVVITLTADEAERLGGLLMYTETVPGADGSHLAKVLEDAGVDVSPRHAVVWEREGATDLYGISDSSVERIREMMK